LETTQAIKEKNQRTKKTRSFYLQMITWGITALNHGSSLAAFSGRELVYYKECLLDELDKPIINQALGYGGPDTIYWYENPYLKKLRQIRAGQWSRVLDKTALPKHYLNNNNLRYAKLKYTPHHASHAAAGYYTAPFDNCAVVVLDAIGEFESASIWHGIDGKLKKVWSRNYPNSLGLFYSAFTDLIGYTPVVDEHVLQELSDQGRADRYYQTVNKYFNGIASLKDNFHRGVTNWPYAVNNEEDCADIAAAVQQVFEEQVDLVMQIARSITNTKNLVYMGGCAMNSKYNRRLGKQWDRIWSLPNPGDASSSIGAVLYHTRQKIEFKQGIAKHLEIKV
jgi:carbamoyltransferase